MKLLFPTPLEPIKTLRGSKATEASLTDLKFLITTLSIILQSSLKSKIAINIAY